MQKGICEICPEKSFRLQIDAYLVEDKNRFFSFLNDEFVKIDIYLAIFIFIFLIILYSTKFYTYVNELSFSLNRNYFDEYLNIYLLWTASLVLFFTMFRFVFFNFRCDLIDEIDVKHITPRDEATAKCITTSEEYPSCNNIK